MENEKKPKFASMESFIESLTAVDFDGYCQDALDK